MYINDDNSMCVNKGLVFCIVPYPKILTCGKGEKEDKWKRVGFWKKKCKGGLSPPSCKEAWTTQWLKVVKTDG